MFFIQIPRKRVRKKKSLKEADHTTLVDTNYSPWNIHLSKMLA
ncbi:hypothetical protein N665_0214s0048 [Sinapis alba]|nr:hypothetical protein N665_0214s0048 [Sinapis alba]